MSIIKNTIRNEIDFIIIYALNTFLLILIFNLLLSKLYILYPVLISTFIFSIYICIKYMKNKRLVINVNNNKIQNYVPTYNIEYKDKLYLDIIKDLHFDYNNELNKQLENSKLSSYMFSQFLHNMKTSVAIIDLAYHSNNENVLDDINIENIKLNQQLQQCLNVLRLQEFSQDYVPINVDLVELVKKVINDNKSNFIYNNVFPKINCESENTFILTDEKWCSYILNQIISNSIKYSNKNGIITFNIFKREEFLVLEIIDNGIGIPEYDLERVWELFYTGDNGRSESNSTGIGLAMVKNVAKYLQIGLSIESKLNVGTKVELTFKYDI